MGQKQTRRNQMVMSALPPKADSRSQLWSVRFGPKPDIASCSYSMISSASFGGEAGRHLDAERLGSLEVDEELELGRLHHRQVPGLLTLENPADVDAG